MSFDAERMSRDFAEDPESRVGLIDRARSAASFLKTFYKTRGKREGQQNLFPEVETEISAKRANSAAGVKWPDRGSAAYRAECERQTAPYIGKRT